MASESDSSGTLKKGKSEPTLIMSQVIGNFEPFEEHSDFKEYLERFEVFADINGITDEVEKTKWLLAYGGPVLFKKIKCCSKNAPSTTALKTLKPELFRLLAPKNIVVLERAKFNLRDQNQGETVSEYALALRALSQFCEFEAALDSALRDRFVIGIRNANTRTALLRSGKTSFDQVVAEV